MINYVNIVGYVGATLEIEHFKSGKKLAKFSVAEISLTSVKSFKNALARKRSLGKFH